MTFNYYDHRSLVMASKALLAILDESDGNRYCPYIKEANNLRSVLDKIEASQQGDSANTKQGKIKVGHPPWCGKCNKFHHHGTCS